MYQVACNLKPPGSELGQNLREQKGQQIPNSWIISGLKVELSLTQCQGQPDPKSRLTSANPFPVSV